jgi:3-phosphoshikimate 1-carboxyvinyltransferase
MLSSLAKGKSIIENFLPSDDCLRTLDAFKSMGVNIERRGDSLYIGGMGLKLCTPQKQIYAGNSGTTTRLLAGILAGQNFSTHISGDESLSQRPMKRIIEPLSLMGASFESQNFHLPMKIMGKSPLKALKYQSEKASAQVKSAILFAGLYADGKTVVREPIKSRDHSERMLKAFGANIKDEGLEVSIEPAKELMPQNIDVPGDISSAAFFIAAALLIPKSNLTIKNVGINPTRDGFLEAIKKMGANIVCENQREISGEAVCDILVRHSQLNAVDIDEFMVPKMIDELPIFAVIAAKACGVSRVSGAGELRVKESDRIKAVVYEFRKMGVLIDETNDGWTIYGNENFDFNGADVESYFDHRIAMSLAVAALCADGETLIRNAECVEISFPNFFKELQKLCL